MKSLHPLYMIGAMGMVITATLQMMFSTMLARPLMHPTFFSLYPLFIAFLIIGNYKMAKQQKAAVINPVV